MDKTAYKITFFSIIVCLLISSCKDKGDVKTIRLESNRIDLQQNIKDSGYGTIKVAIATMLSPGKTFNAYVDLINYISKKINVPVKFVQRKSYGEINELLEAGYIDLAFICSGAYVEAKRHVELEIIAVPIVNGKPYYYSYLIVPAEKGIDDISELKDKKFAFVDPLSNTGRLYPIYLLNLHGYNPATFFSEIIYTHSHDRSIELVAQGLVDGASVDSLVWDYYVKSHPEINQKVKIINRSQAFGIPPFVSTPATDRGLRKAIRKIMLDMHLDEEGKTILSSIGVERFELGDDSLYDTIREIKDMKK